MGMIRLRCVYATLPDTAWKISYLCFADCHFNLRDTCRNKHEGHGKLMNDLPIDCLQKMDGKIRVADLHLFPLVTCDCLFVYIADSCVAALYK